MQIRNQHDQEADNDVIFRKFSFRPQSTSIRKFFEIITIKESIKIDNKLFLFSLIYIQNIL